jgi:uncharacterized protein (TIGR00375 family)
MEFIADLHIHSKYSRATAKNLDLENLHIAAQCKGIRIIGTGDFTHPGWFAEISEKLVPAEAGLFKLNDELARVCDQQVPGACRQPVRFMLTAEISNIYKKAGKTRKNHNLVFVPDLDTAQKFSASLDKIGNIRSDGRPILGLDARDLLEIVLETSDAAFLVPAHIWTPWFSLLGSKSGFDSIKACFQDLTPHIFAVETGLSSDPPMNWRVSDLDGLTLISNSDAHSPLKLGREANLFDTRLSYLGLWSALRSGDPSQFLGTIEFFPEEGKYHLDGHRKCSLRLWPRETIKNKGICPVCGKPLTCGVLYRVEELADRPQGLKPEKYHPYVNMIPLVEVLAEIFDVGSGSKRVLKHYRALLEKFGSEFSILRSIEPDNLVQAGIPMLDEALRRIRQNKIEISPGYDGEFGGITIFHPSERDNLGGQQTLFAMPVGDSKKNDRLQKTAIDQTRPPKQQAILNTGVQPADDTAGNKSFQTGSGLDGSDGLRDGLNPEQIRAVENTAGPLLIVAGPGTGKTLTLTHRIAYLISKLHVDPRSILAVTFTNKASEQMRRRLENLLDGSVLLPLVATFHALCLQMLKEIDNGQDHTLIDDIDRSELMSKAFRLAQKEGHGILLKPQKVFDRISSAKQRLLTAEDLITNTDAYEGLEAVAAVYRLYQRLLSSQRLYDYEDLVFRVVRFLETDSNLCWQYQERFQHILVDEYQDLNEGQYRLIRALAPLGRNLFAIGDPDQSIYGFRGSDVQYFKQFIKDYPNAGIVHLKKNYRSTQTILNASRQVIIAGNAGQKTTSRIYSGIEGIRTIGIFETDSEKAEAVAVGKTIEQMIGGVGFYSLDFGKVDGFEDRTPFGFSDFAILYRTGAQGERMGEILGKAGIPCQTTHKKYLHQNKGRSVILSYLKIIDNAGSYLDLERIAGYALLKLKKAVLETFIDWGFEQSYTLTQALAEIKRCSIPGMNRQDQRKMAAYADQLQGLQAEIRPLAFRQKIDLIYKNLNPRYFDKHPDHADQRNEILNLAGDCGQESADFLVKMALQTDTDLYDSKTEKVALLTMHAAKGLEFPVVFITGCEKDLIPLRPPEGAVQNIEEERRLFYVAMTRAKELLYLTYARKRNIYGKLKARAPSPFVLDIEKRLKRYERSDKIRPKQADKGPQQLKLF